METLLHAASNVKHSSETQGNFASLGRDGSTPRTYDEMKNLHFISKALLDMV